MCSCARRKRDSSGLQPLISFRVGGPPHIQVPTFQRSKVPRNSKIPEWVRGQRGRGLRPRLPGRHVHDCRSPRQGASHIHVSQSPGHLIDSIVGGLLFIFQNIFDFLGKLEGDFDLAITELLAHLRTGAIRVQEVYTGRAFGSMLFQPPGGFRIEVGIQ